MSTTTSNLGLFKYTESDYEDDFNLQIALNENWDKLDLVCSPTYQDIITLSNDTIVLQQDKVLYYYIIPSSTTFTFSTVNLSLSLSKAYTFELLLYQATAYSLTFPSSVKWQDNTTPTMTASGYYFFAFRTIDGGTTWKGSLQGVWQ